MSLYMFWKRGFGEVLPLQGIRELAAVGTCLGETEKGVEGLRREKDGTCVKLCGS
jgi:hypothetical protein